jgi:hypothetical protein
LFYGYKDYCFQKYLKTCEMKQNRGHSAEIKTVAWHRVAVISCVAIDAIELGVSLHVALTLIKQNFITDYHRNVTTLPYILQEPPYAFKHALQHADKLRVKF